MLTPLFYTPVQCSTTPGKPKAPLRKVDTYASSSSSWFQFVCSRQTKLRRISKALGKINKSSLSYLKIFFNFLIYHFILFLCL